MVVVLVAIGFPPDQIYKMGLAEFNYFFLQALSVIKRGQQMSSLNFAGTIGSFFVEKKQKTIFEALAEEITEIQGLLGNSKELENLKTPEALVEKKKEMVARGRKAVSKLFGQLRGQKGIKG